MYTPPHEVIDEEKLQSMIETLRSGGQLPAIVVIGNEALCGSHRIAAVEEARKRWESYADGWDESPEPTLAAIELTGDEYQAACEYAGVDYLDELIDCNDVCRVVYESTEREEVKKALADQKEAV